MKFMIIYSKRVARSLRHTRAQTHIDSVRERKRDSKQAITESTNLILLHKCNKRSAVPRSASKILTKI